LRTNWNHFEICGLSRYKIAASLDWVMDSVSDRSGRIGFAPFVLDAAEARLYRGADIIRLRGKSLSVLEYLAQRPGQLVTKDELLTALWPETYVSEAALAGCVRELRHALGDSRGQPRFIETVYGRGYRFIAGIEPSVSGRQPAAEGSAEQIHRESPATSHDMVGRTTELGQLQMWLRKAAAGRRQLGFIAGDAGIGKTSLVNAFIESVSRGESPPLVAVGQCIEQYGPGEPFLPLLDALARLSRHAANDGVGATVHRCVPRWLLSRPGEATEAPPAGAAERAIRLLVEAIEAVAADHLLILLVEDLHWSDPSTLDVLSRLAQRPDPARLLVIGTYRPVDAILRQHPLRIVERELRARRQSTQLTLGPLSENAVIDWLERLGPNPPTSLGEWLYLRTDGHPLFLSALLEELTSDGRVKCDGRVWTVSSGFAEAGVPQSVRLMIDEHIDRLPTDDQQLLEAASAVGVQFSAAVVAAALGREIVQVEERCSGLARRGQFLSAGPPIDWPDGTIAGGYAFLHALYQNVLYERLPPARRQQLHARIAQRLQRGYGAYAEDCAVELAVHFELGRDAVNAIRNRERAAHRCNRRGAHREAAASVRRALELVESLPDSRDRAQQSLWLSLMLATALIPTEGYADPEVQTIFQRCCRLAEQLGERPQLFAALSGLATCYLARGELSAAAPVGDQLLHLAKAMPVPLFAVLAHAGVGWRFCCEGNFGDALEHLLYATAVYAEGVPRETINIDPGTLAITALCLALLPLGRLDEARARMAAEIARCRKSARPIDRVSVLASSALLHGNLGEAAIAEAQAAESLALAVENGLRAPPIAAAVHACATAMRDGCDAALGNLADRLAEYRAAGFGTYLSAILLLAADAHGRAGRIEAALALVTQAVEHVESTGERWCEAELYRLRGELLATQHRGGGAKSGGKRQDQRREAERCIARALDVARRQGAKLWELRATVSLARLRHEQGRTVEARALLEPIGTFLPQAQNSADVRAAQVLLERWR